MRGRLMRGLVAGAAGLAVSAAAAVPGAHALQQVTRIRAAAPVATVASAPGSRLWVARYNGPGDTSDSAHAMAISPGGGTVFVTGQSYGGSSGSDYATVAYNAATGAQLWVARYNGPANGYDSASSVAVSPSGGTVFVTGASTGTASGSDYATIAYDAVTGAQLWVARYNGPGNGDDSASSVAVSPSGATVFVTGNCTGATGGFNAGFDDATIAYNAASGTQLWVRRYNGPGNGYDVGAALAVSPGGGTVFVTGPSTGVTSGRDYATIAYNATTGRRLWTARYNGPGNSDDESFAVAVAPAGDAVFVTGVSDGVTSSADYATIGYNAVTGARLWLKRYNGPGNAGDSADSVTVSPSGSTVFVTGQSQGVTSRSDYATIAYNATTGRRLWTARYNGPGNNIDAADAVAVSPGGGTVYVTGWSYGAPVGGSTFPDYATIAYSAATGARQWVARYNGPANRYDYASALTVSPATGTVFVTGASQGTTPDDYATVAYHG